MSTDIEQLEDALKRINEASVRADVVTNFIKDVASGPDDLEVSNPEDPSNSTPTIRKMVKEQTALFLSQMSERLEVVEAKISGIEEQLNNFTMTVKSVEKTNVIVNAGETVTNDLLVSSGINSVILARLLVSRVLSNKSYNIKLKDVNGVVLYSNDGLVDNLTDKTMSVLTFTDTLSVEIENTHITEPLDIDIQFDYI